MVYNPDDHQELISVTEIKPKKPSIFNSIKNKWNQICPFGKKDDKR